MPGERFIHRILKSKPTLEGAGVRLKRAFGFYEVTLFDPFLLLDDFHSDNPDDYRAGFPWHPHRGIETVTYMLHGSIDHRDSLGNSGTIHAGDVQWMTAGSGIIHSEMPDERSGMLRGFQLWVNLPASHKMMTPRYRDITGDSIPRVTMENGVDIRVICGTAENVTGPAQDIVAGPRYLDITVPPGNMFSLATEPDHTVLAYVVTGGGYFDRKRNPFVREDHVVAFGSGGPVAVTTTSEPVRFLLISGRPLGEPVAWHGPIVMNTREELERAFEEYNNGTFIREPLK